MECDLECSCKAEKDLCSFCINNDDDESEYLTEDAINNFIPKHHTTATIK